jgi:WhiB family transcriptional regulator, redox-sensing transcriptional regulator
MRKQTIFAPPSGRLVPANRRKTEAMDWHTRAACVHADFGVFFPGYTAGPMIDRAKQICGGCPVRTRCLDWALSNGAVFGIWGGRTEAERHAMGGRRD